MNADYVEIIRAASEELQPVPTNVSPELAQFSGIRAVMFDIYGTLLVSASGDIGAADPTIRGQAFAEAIAAVGGYVSADSTTCAAELRGTIERYHRQARAAGVEYPEVDIVEVWNETCRLLVQQGDLRLPDSVDFDQLAIEFEVRVNPVWPMPGLVECLETMRDAGVVMGIISNAQFFTPVAFRAVVGKSLDQLGFAPRLRYYSYEHRRAKPGKELYELAVAGLAAAGTTPSEVLYLGNDMRNDIWPAAAVGFRTALFAGDQRSLRLRSEDQTFSPQPPPDATVTNLLQINSLVHFEADR